MSAYQMYPAAGAAPQVGALLAMLEASRASTLSAVEGLSADALAYQVDKQANPISALLSHITAIEFAYYASTLATTPPTPDEWGRYMPSIRLGPSAWEIARGRSLDELVGALNAVRARTVEALAAKPDSWLVETISMPWLPTPATPLWAWYHVLEDELNHRGQIRFLRSRIPVSSTP